MKLIAMSTQDAQWAGMAPAVAGGWVMTEPVACLALDIAGVLRMGERLAWVSDTLPVDGRAVESVDVVSALGSALERTERRVWGLTRRESDAEALRTWIERVEIGGAR